MLNWIHIEKSYFALHKLHVHPIIVFQVNLDDRFGEVMLANLKSRECTLAGVDACLSLGAQKDRYV